MTAVKKPDDLKQNNIRKFMVFGTDAGRIEDIINSNLEWFCAQNPNLEVRRFSEDDIVSDFSGFENSISNSSLFGDAAIGILRLHTESVANKISDLITENSQLKGGLFIIGIGLSQKGRLVNAFEKASDALVLRTFDPSIAELLNAARAIAQKEHITIDNDTLRMIVDATLKDTLSLKAQMSTLCLYAGRGGTLDFETVHKILIDNKDGAIDDAINAAFEGRLSAALEGIYFCLRDGESPIRILNLLIIRAKLLYNLICNLDSFPSASLLVKEKRFGIFWKQQDAIANQINLWANRKLDFVMRDLIEIDAKCKAKGGSIDPQLLIERGIMRIAQLSAANN